MLQSTEIEIKRQRKASLDNTLWKIDNGAPLT